MYRFGLLTYSRPFLLRFLGYALRATLEMTKGVSEKADGQNFFDLFGEKKF